MDFLRIPFFDAVRDAKTVLLAGAGGGYDIYSAVPLYVGLKAAGKTVHLANLSFTSLHEIPGTAPTDTLVTVTPETEGPRYFPELHLSRWLHETRGETVPIHCFARTGVAPIRRAYQKLAQQLGPVDALILVDGGTDSLMRGDESGLGTPEEDMASLCAADELKSVPIKLLVCLGFGVDFFHGVCHAQFLEAVADLTREGAFLGAWSVTPDMPEAIAYREAVDWVTRAMPFHPSIVSSSIASAVEGRFGNYHTTKRTEGSRLFINPLMTLYWAFQLEPVVRRNLYLHELRDLESYREVTAAIELFRYQIQDKVKPWQELPM